MLARTIVLIIRKRGGRFLKKEDETGELYEVGDQKAEAKTSQALREGLDVRATKNAANLMDKKGKKKKNGAAAAAVTAVAAKGNSKPNEETTNKEENSPEDTTAASAAATEDKEPKEETPTTTEAGAESKDATPTTADKNEDRPKTPPTQRHNDTHKTPPPSPPSLPKLGACVGFVHPHSPEALQFRKRRRMRSGEGACLADVDVVDDKLFPDFCPPRADLARPAPTEYHYNEAASREYDKQEEQQMPAPGCAGIAMGLLTGGAFCLGPSNWRKR